jgi:filamentous hemagglutinin family protein
MHGRVHKADNNIGFDMKILPLLGCLVAAILIDSFANRSEAQITPDRTLGSESSEFSNDKVLGGARRGDNLFHSFKEFSIGATQRVDFVNDANAVNIITRVTDTESKINGILGVAGRANFFLINPHGISFGGGAKLEMSGTFVGSTASSLKFADGTIFDATASGAPLLTMSTPIGLQFGQNPASITLKDSGNLTLTNPGNPERSYNGSSFLLVGGNIELDNSKIFLRGGKIELAAIGDQGNAGINIEKFNNSHDSIIKVSDNNVHSDVVIKNESKVSSGGDIIINARNLNLLDGGTLITESNSNNFSRGGSVKITTTGEVKLSESNNGKENNIGTRLIGQGNGGDIIIKTSRLINQSGGQIYTDDYDEIDKKSTGQLGKIEITASESIKVIGVSNIERISGFFKPTGITAFATGSKKAGDINIRTPFFLLQDGASISSGTDSFVDGGTISVTGLDNKNARLVEIVGNSGIGKALGIHNVSGLSGIGNGSRIRSITTGACDFLQRKIRIEK